MNAIFAIHPDGPMMRYLMPALVALLMATPAMAQPYSSGAITVDGTIIQEGPPRSVTLGGFATIRNDGAEPDTLVGMESPDVESIKLFEATLSEGISRMVPLSGGIEVPAGATVKLGAIGYHPMFNGPIRPLRAGDTIAVTMTFEKAGPIETVFMIDRMLPGQTPVGADHSTMNMSGGMDMNAGGVTDGQ